MASLMKFLIPLLILGIVLLFSYGFGIIKSQKKQNKIVSFIILGFGVVIDVTTTILIVKQNESGRICDLTPGCMNETGMLYIIFGFFLVIGTIILLTGLVKVIKSYQAKK